MSTPIMIFIIITSLFYISFKEPTYVKCEVKSFNETYEIIRRADFYIEPNGRPLKISHNNREITLTDYSTSCVPYSKETK